LGPGPGARAAADPFEKPTQGCALGISGPTLDPARALREARDDAFAALAAEQLGVDVSSEVGWAGTRVHVRARERTSGRLQGVWIAGLRPRPGGGIDAIACVAHVDARASARFRNAAIRWPPAFRRQPRCALGVAGHRLGPGDQQRVAWHDAREMLARAVEARVVHRLELEAQRRPRRGHSVRPTAVSTQLIEEAEDHLERREWLDEKGRGPLRRPGLLYVELCLPER
jgi:hypothetical protein